METELCPYYGPDGVRYVPARGEDCLLGSVTNGKRKQGRNARWVEAGRIPGNRGREDLDALVSFIEGHASVIDSNGYSNYDDSAKLAATKSRRTKASQSEVKSPSSSASSDGGDSTDLIQSRSVLTSNRDSGDSAWSNSPSSGSSQKQLQAQTVSASSSGLLSDAEPDYADSFHNEQLIGNISTTSPVATSRNVADKEAQPAGLVTREASEYVVSSGVNSATNDARSRCETVTESDENDVADDEDELFTPVRTKTSRRAKQRSGGAQPVASAVRHSPVARRGDQPRFTKQSSYPTDAAYAKVASTAKNGPSARPVAHSVSVAPQPASHPSNGSNLLVPAPNVISNSKPAWNVVATQRQAVVTRAAQPSSTPAQNTAAKASPTPIATSNVNNRVPTVNKWPSITKPSSTLNVANGQTQPQPQMQQPSKTSELLEKEQSLRLEAQLKEVRAFVDNAFRVLVERTKAKAEKGGETAGTRSMPQVYYYRAGFCLHSTVDIPAQPIANVINNCTIEAEKPHHLQNGSLIGQAN